MIVTHNLGFPRIGAQRELKQALEAYWCGDSARAGLEQVYKPCAPGIGGNRPTPGWI